MGQDEDLGDDGGRIGPQYLSPLSSPLEATDYQQDFKSKGRENFILGGQVIKIGFRKQN
jgi:hypothetical protein